MPEELRPVFREAKRLWRVRLIIRGSMLATPDGDELRRLADQAVTTGKAYRAKWAVINRWRNTGMVIRTDLPKPLPLAKLFKKRDSLRVSLSQYRNGHRRATPEKIAAKESELQEILTLIENAAVHAE